MNKFTSSILTFLIFKVSFSYGNININKTTILSNSVKVVSSENKGIWQGKSGDRVCILLKSEIKLSLPKEIIYNSNNTFGLHEDYEVMEELLVPKDAHALALCGDEIKILQISWTIGVGNNAMKVHLQFHFLKDGNHFSLEKITLSYFKNQPCTLVFPALGPPSDAKEVQKSIHCIEELSLQVVDNNSSAKLQLIGFDFSIYDDAGKEMQCGRTFPAQISIGGISVYTFLLNICMLLGGCAIIFGVVVATIKLHRLSKLKSHQGKTNELNSPNFV